MSFSDRIHSQPKSWIVGEAIVFLLLIGFVDYELPFEWTLLMFYFPPILFTAWYGGRKSALIVAGLSAAVWWVANATTIPYSQEVLAWSACNRLATFIVVALGGAAMRAQRETMQARVVALERARELEEEILRVTERAHMRLGQELHDGICQQLAAIDCAVACLRHDVEEHTPPDPADLEFVHSQIASVVVQARDMARGVFPVQLDEEGFLASLEEVVENLNRLRQFRVDLKLDGDIKIKSPETAMHLFRIAQEALSNVTKHARASRVEIELARADGHLTMTILDDGVGLAGVPGDRKGIGMQTMSFRAKSMGGQVEVLNAPGGGTSVRCTVPMERPAEMLYAV